MKKMLLKLFMPDAKTLSKYIVNGIQKTLEASGKQELIAKYGNSAEAFTKAQETIVRWLKDGNLDEQEKIEVQEKIEPWIQKAIDLL